MKTVNKLKVILSFVLLVTTSIFLITCSHQNTTHTESTMDTSGTTDTAPEVTVETDSHEPHTEWETNATETEPAQEPSTDPLLPEESSKETSAPADPTETSSHFDDSSETKDTEPTTAPPTLPPQDVEPTVEVNPDKETEPISDFEEYCQMTPEEKREFFNSFENPDDFFNWYNQSKKEYEDQHPNTIVDGDTIIDFGSN